MQSVQKTMLATAIVIGCAQQPESRVAAQECLDDCIGVAKYMADCGDELWIVLADGTETTASPSEYCENDCTLVRYMLDAACEEQHRILGECIGELDWTTAQCLSDDQYINDLDMFDVCDQKASAWESCLFAAY